MSTYITIQQAAQSAIDVQDACNVSGVTLSLGNILCGPIYEEMQRFPGRDGNFRSCHPVTVAFLDKLVSLTRCYEQDFTAATNALDACAALAKAKDLPAVDRIYAVWNNYLSDVRRWDGGTFRKALQLASMEVAEIAPNEFTVYGKDFTIWFLATFTTHWEISVINCDNDKIDAKQIAEDAFFNRVCG
jgi:hypothetical protein